MGCGGVCRETVESGFQKVYCPEKKREILKNFFRVFIKESFEKRMRILWLAILSFFLAYWPEGFLSFKASLFCGKKYILCGGVSISNVSI